jgi:hypothetical protein
LYDRIILCDTEFTHPITKEGGREGNLPTPICVCFHELHSGVSFSLWDEELHIPSPITFTGNDLFICYNAGAELSIFTVLGWPLPTHLLDLMVVYRQEICLIPKEDTSYGLSAALEHYKIETPLQKEYKKKLQERCIEGFPFDEADKRKILKYCMEDTTEMVKLMRCLPEVSLTRFLSYGRYMKSVAAIEQTGLPVHMDTYRTLKHHWGEVKAHLRNQVNAVYKLYDAEGKFKTWWFEDFVATRGYTWKRTETGALNLETEYFKEQATLHGKESDVAKIYERWKTLQLLDTFNPPVGDDGFCRCSVMPFSSQTSRNQPSTARFIMGMAKWLRSMMMAPLGYVLVSVDYCQQEFMIAAVLSGDEQMMADYRAGDVYLKLAKKMYDLPANATKADPKVKGVRDKVKTMVLGTQYSMGATGLSARAGDPIDILGRKFLDEFERNYRVFDDWRNGAAPGANLHGCETTALGWTLYLGGMGNFDAKTKRHNKPNERSLANFPIQGTGADILRVASSLLYEAGIVVCAPVHDAVLLLLPDDEEFALRLHYALYLMMRASEAVLGPGNILNVEVKAFPHGEFYYDSGAELWVDLSQVEALATLPQCQWDRDKAPGKEYKPDIQQVYELFQGDRL